MFSGGQGVHREVEFEGLEEKCRAGINECEVLADRWTGNHEGYFNLETAVNQ